MEFLKRNGMGLAAILCCCVLGVLLAQQSGQLQGLRQENDALTTRLDAAESAAEPEVPAAAPSARILASSVDPETRMLTREKPIGWHGNGPVSSSRRMGPTPGH